MYSIIIIIYIMYLKLISNIGDTKFRLICHTLSYPTWLFQEKIPVLKELHNS